VQGNVMLVEWGRMRVETMPPLHRLTPVEVHEEEGGYGIEKKHEPKNRFLLWLITSYVY
jgi:hypothetical protein